MKGEFRGVDHSAIENRDMFNPTPQDLESPIFEALWSVMKFHDVKLGGGLYSGATGNDVVIVMDKFGLREPR